MRYKLQAENKIGKYLIYAIGEIFLVVIGILIALYINNKNQEYQIENRTNAILEEVAKDLEWFINMSNNQLGFYAKKQRIFDLLLNDKLTYEDYANSTYTNLTGATTWYSGGGKRQVAYKNLISEINTIPNKYKSIVDDLSSFYDNEFNVEYTKLIERISIENERKRVDKYEWYSLSIPDSENEEMINFMLHYFRYKNEAKYYYKLISYHLGFIVDDKIKARKIIDKINDALERPSDGKSDKADLKSYEELVGDWKNKEFPDYEVSIKESQGKLFYQSNFDTAKHELSPVLTDLYIDKDHVFWAVEKNDEEVGVRVINLEFYKSED